MRQEHFFRCCFFLCKLVDMHSVIFGLEVNAFVESEVRV